MAIGWTSGMRRRLLCLPARLACFGTSLGPVERRSLRRYAAARHRHAPRLPRLDGVARGIVDGLHRNGVHAVPIEALGIDGSAALLGEARALARRQAEHFARAQAGGQSYIVAPADAIAARPALFRAGLDLRLLDIVEAYLGLPVGYDGVVLQHSPVDAREEATRAWHRDREDRAMLKVAVYLNDVDEGGGPFELIGDPAAPSTICLGPAGTVIFADTARHLHRGRPVTRTPRSALFFSYFSDSPRHPYFCERSGLTRRQVRRLVAGMAPAQQKAALWKDRLSLPMRLVPAAPL